MSTAKPWQKLNAFASPDQCQAAVDSLDPDHRTRLTPKVDEIFKMILEKFGDLLEDTARKLKPGVKGRRCYIGQFRPQPKLTSTSGVYLYIGLTRLDKAAGMFSFVKEPQPPEGEEEEEVVIEPGEGIMWRGDCARKLGDGHGDGGVMLIIVYE